MAERTIVVTGTTSGLGEALVERLARSGCHIVLGHRDAARAAAIVERLRRRDRSASVEPLRIDLASLTSVREAVGRLRDGDRPPLGGIVANGAVQVVNGVRASADGYELTFATNHLGHFALATGLLDVLTDDARVVVVSSGTHQGALGFPGPRWAPAPELADVSEADPSPAAGRVRYATSKLANLYFAYELARRVAGRGITVNAYDPGLMPATGLSRGYSPVARVAYRALAPVIAAVLPGARTAKGSARHLAELVIGERFAGRTGLYVAGPRIAESSLESHDLEAAAALWAESEALLAAAADRRDERS